MKKSLRLIPVVLAVCLMVLYISFGVSGNKTADAAPNDNVVKIVIPNEYKEMGSYSIWIEESSGNLISIPKTKDNLYTFETGTVIVVKALPNPFYEIRDTKQNFPSEKIAEDTLRVTVLTNRDLVFLFEKQVLESNQENISKKISNGKLTVENADEISIGSEVYVTVELDSIYEVKDFIINGIAVNNSNYRGNIEYQNNFATIHITEDWLLGYGKTLNIEVTTKIKQTFFIVGLCVVIVVPLLLIFILQMIISNSRSKKTAAASLTGKLITAQRSNTGNFVKQLREGKFGTINKKSIKEEIKSSLGEAAEANIAAKKAAREDEVPQVDPKPTKKTYKLIELFEESTLKPDKTFVKGGKVIATLREDLTIVDKSGKMIATANIENGKLLDKDNNAVGLITADGAIKKIIVL